MSEPVRKDLFMRAALQLLADEMRPMRFRELLEQIPVLVTPTAYELVASSRVDAPIAVKRPVAG